MRDLPVKIGELWMLLRDTRELQPLEKQNSIVFTGLSNEGGMPYGVASAVNVLRPAAGFLTESEHRGAERLMELFAVAPQALEALLDRLSRAATLAVIAGVDRDNGQAERELWSILEPFLD